jgi:type I restriction enzyme S subunit
VTWPTIRLGNICDVQSGGTPLVSNKEYWGGGIAWYSSGELNAALTSAPERTISNSGLANSNAKIFPVGSLLIGMYDTAALKMSILDRDGAFNQAIAGVRPSPNVDLQFVMHSINSMRPSILGQRRGVRQKNLSLAKIRDIEFRLPPLPEQRRIVSILDEAFAGLEAMRANAERNLQNARELSASLSHSIFSGQPSWTDASLGEIVAADCSLSYGIVQPGNEFADGLPIVRPTDLVRRIVELDGLKRIDPSLAASYQRTKLRGGDLLLCVRGTTGTVAIASKSLAGANVTRGIVPVRFDPTKVTAQFGYHLLRCEDVQAQIRAKTYGTALMQINIKDLRELCVRVPILSEQKAISERLDAVDDASKELFEIYSEKLAAIDELKQSILQKAFAGKLTATAAVAA